MSKNGMSQVTGAPTPFEVNGQTLMLSPMRFREWGIVEQWMRAEVIKAACESLKGIDLDMETKRQVIATAQDEAAKLSIAGAFGVGMSDQKARGYMFSLSGMTKIVLVSAQRANPRLTEDGLQEILAGDTKALADAFTEVSRISFPQEAKSDDGDSSKNVQRDEEPRPLTD